MIKKLLIDFLLNSFFMTVLACYANIVAYYLYCNTLTCTKMHQHVCSPFKKGNNLSFGTLFDNTLLVIFKNDFDYTHCFTFHNNFYYSLIIFNFFYLAIINKLLSIPSIFFFWGGGGGWGMKLPVDKPLPVSWCQVVRTMDRTFVIVH